MSVANNRSIRLTRIHALNWYGYKDSVPVDGNLLLAGVTGSGKSILMDLIQFVIVGDLRLVRFNQSATGDRSDRSLKGYVLGDTKQEEAGVTQYMRDSAITYVALEFSWPKSKKVETWGFRVEFSSSAETQGRTTPFYIPAALTRSDFLDENRCPLDYPSFKAMVESHLSPEGNPGRTYAELSEYLTQMAQPAHLNFDRSVLRNLLPTAMSFTFLKSFNDFCRHFILSAERLDVRDVSDSYRAFLRYEKDLVSLNDQYERLKSICESYTRGETLTRDAVLARFLEAELRYEHAEALFKEEDGKLQKLKEACLSEESRLGELERIIPVKRDEVDRMKQDIGETSDGKLYLEIKRQNSRLVTEIERLKQTGATLQNAMQNRVRQAKEWFKALIALPLELKHTHVGDLETAISSLEASRPADFGPRLRTLSQTGEVIASEVARLAAPAQKRLFEIRTELGNLRDQINNLSHGRLPFPTRLLDALNQSLPSFGGEPAARHLRDLCELAENEERWRPAIEVAFTRKFAVVVSEEQYDAAERIYHQLREEARGESLVNPTKALKSRRTPKPNSLATKLVTKHPVAQAIINQLFGELICVDRREELRNHDAAITPDGFMIRGAFVERSRHYDNLPFVGRRGLQQQLAWKEELRDRLNVEERQLRPLAEGVDTLLNSWKIFNSQGSLSDEIAAARYLPEKQAELDENIKRLNEIDRAKFDDLAMRQANLEAELRELERERRELDRSEQRAQLQQQTLRLEEITSRRKELAVRYEEIKEKTDVAPHLERVTEMKNEVLEKFSKLDAAAYRLHDLAIENEKTAAEEWVRLVAARRELAMVHPKFEDLWVEASNNEAYEKQFERLGESEIPDYKTKAERERRNWEQLFRTQVLEKLRHALFEVENTRVLLNSYLKKPIGNNRYRIVKWENPDFGIYHRLLNASALAYDGEFFFASADAELRDATAHFLRLLVEQPDSVEATRLLDYRHYYEYDMEVDTLGDQGEVKATARVDRQSGKFSGGENQSPYFIAILASYLRGYKRHDTRSKLPSLAVVPIDEAFSKLSGERIKDCITALNDLGLQGVFSMSTGNIPYAFEHCDSLVVVSKEERRVGKRSQIRNVPVSLHKDSPEARRLLGVE